MPTRFVSQLALAISQEDGDCLSDSFSIYNGSSPRLDPEQQRELDSACARQLDEPWADMCAAYFKVKSAMNASDYVTAYEQQVKLAQNFYRAFATQSKWALPIAYTVCTELRELALLADVQLGKAGGKTGKLEDAARTISKAFSICTTDRSPLPQSRKWGTYFFINLLFKIYFKIKRQNLCTNVLRSLKVSDLPDLSLYPVSQQATFRYFQGILSFLKEDYVNAEQNLDAADFMCHDSSPKNTRLILEFLLPTKLLRGILPNLTRLQHYDSISETYAPFVKAIHTGKVGDFDSALVKHEKRLLELGTYLIVEKARALAMRRLFKKVYIIKDRSTRISVGSFQLGLKCAGVEMDVEEVECMLANMIYKGYIKGYISHEKSMVVLSANNPFPRVTGFGGR